MKKAQYCYISEEYYKNNHLLIKILDISDSSKHNIRTHLCLSVDINKNKVLIPLRKNLPNPVRPYGRIGYPVPSKEKPMAGLDYRYSMIINDISFVRYDNPRIPLSQQKIIEDNYTTIEKQVLEYIRSYIHTANKNRVESTARFRESSLVNFHKELGIKNK